MTAAAPSTRTAPGPAPGPAPGRPLSLTLLQGSAALWFATAAAGQVVFALYVLAHYGGSTLRGEWDQWGRTMIHGIVAGDPVGNAAVALHLLLAFVITVGGPLQLTPWVRRRFPRFHRLVGRTYMATAFTISLGGLWMVWTRGVLGPISNAVAISLNALLIMGFAGMALREALRRRFDAHRRWATRLFLAVSGVWFFRVGLMAWIAANGGPIGVGEALDGPFALAWAYGQYLLPLAIHQLYLGIQTRGGAIARTALAAGLTLCAAGTALGVAMATLFMWLPKLTG